MTPDQIQALSDDKIIEAFLIMRKRRDEAKAAFVEDQKPLLAAMATLEGEAQRRMTENDSTGFKSAHGTCFSKTDTSVTTKDKGAFFDWLTESGKWELADVRPAKKEIQQFAEDTGGDLPPGVNMTQRIVAQFRAPTNK